MQLIKKVIFFSCKPRLVHLPLHFYHFQLVTRYQLKMKKNKYIVTISISKGLKERQLPSLCYIYQRKPSSKET